MVHGRMPEFVSAQSLQNFEILRLTNDPILGGINKKKILEADKKIKTDRLKKEDGYKAVMERYEKKLLKPKTKSDLKLRAERRKIQDVQNLADQMGNAFSQNKLCKPAMIAEHRHLAVSTRINNPREIPKKTTSKSKLVTESAAQQKTWDMIELIKRRDNEIAAKEAALH